MATIDERKVYTHSDEWRTPQTRAADREKLARDTEVFLASGAQIQHVPFGLSKNSPPDQWHRMGSLALKRKKA